MSDSASEDPIVKEIREIRDRFDRECNYDVHTMFERIKAHEKASGFKFVAYPAKRIDPDTTT